MLCVLYVCAVFSAQALHALPACLTYEDADTNAAEVEAVQELMDLRHLHQHCTFTHVTLQLGDTLNTAPAAQQHSGKNRSISCGQEIR